MSSAYGYSSHYMFSPEMESGYIDHLLVRPHTGWRGQRGVRLSFGAEEEFEDDEFGDDDFEDDDFDDEDFGGEADDIDAMFSDLHDELDSELFGEDDYGRLYASPEGYYPVEASPGDRGSLLGRSGSSGFRGGRPSFGAKIEVLGVGSYEGTELGVFAMGLGVLAVAGKALKVF